MPIRHTKFRCARASGFYWNRVAGLLVRLTFRLWHVRHSAKIYVDDLLAILLRSSAPLLSGLLVALLCVFRSDELAQSSSPPKSRGSDGPLTSTPLLLSWISPSCAVCWICSSFCLSRPVAQFQQEKLTGKLLWLSNSFQPFRPTRLCVSLCLKTFASLPPFRLRPFPWAASCFELHTPQSQGRPRARLIPTCLGSGCQSPTSREGAFT